MTQILSRRAWGSLVLLPIVGVIGTLLAYLLMSLYGGRGASAPREIVSSVLVVLAGMLLGVALWPIVLFRLQSRVRLAGYGALATVTPIYFLLTPAAASWGYPRGGYEASLLSTMTVGLVIVLAAGCGLLVARLTLARSPWYPTAERGVRTSRRHAAHLFWSVPLAAIISAPIWFVGGISLCGISGCSGGGFGRDTSYQVQSWISCVVIGVIFALAVGLVPWIRPGRVRVCLGVAAGLATGGGQALLWLSSVWYL
ncbi:MAG: hypothetical protein ABI305_02380 [Tepidiformaceae bacterium]